MFSETTLTVAFQEIHKFVVYTYNSLHFTPQRSRLESLHALLLKALRAHTCSGLSPGGTQAYSSKAQPESSSEVEFLWKSYMSLVTVFSISTGMAVTACSSRRHLQCTQIFLPGTRDKRTFRQSDSRRVAKIL